MTPEQARKLQASGDPVYYIGRYDHLRRQKFYIRKVTNHQAWVSPIKDGEITQSSCHILRLKSLYSTVPTDN